MLTCGTVLSTDQTLWNSVEHASRIMCARMRACARMLWGRASPPPKQKMENMEKTKTWKSWKKLALPPFSHFSVPDKFARFLFECHSPRFESLYLPQLPADRSDFDVHRALIRYKPTVILCALHNTSRVISKMLPEISMEPMRFARIEAKKN